MILFTYIYIIIIIIIIIIYLFYKLSKRTLRETIEPIFQIRLDLEGTSSDNSTLNSHHLECDIPTLKFINEELQRAVDEYKGVHSQRISKYFS